MWTSAALQSLSVTSMPIVKILGAPTGAHVKLDSLEMGKLVAVSSNSNSNYMKNGFHYLLCTRLTVTITRLSYYDY